jgi:hypothetical protein
MRRIEFVQTLGRRIFATMVSIGSMDLLFTVSFAFRPLAFCDMPLRMGRYYALAGRRR